MGQSYVTGKDSEIEVRDSTFELVLERLFAELEQSPSGNAKDKACKTVQVWMVYWESMPPGCKELNIGGLSEDVSSLLKAMLDKVQSAAPLGSETEFVAERVGDVLRGGAESQDL